VTAGKTLIIAGAVDQNGDTKAEVTSTLTVSGTLEVAPGAEVTVSASGTLTAAAGAEVAIPNGAKVTVENGGSVDLAALEDGSVTLEGSGTTIEVASGGTLKLPAPNTAPGATQYEVAQIDYNDSNIKINAGGSVYMVSTDDDEETDYYIGPAESGAKYEWGHGNAKRRAQGGGRDGSYRKPYVCGQQRNQHQSNHKNRRLDPDGGGG
jgi:hypothetical protein